MADQPTTATTHQNIAPTGRVTAEQRYFLQRLEYLVCRTTMISRYLVPTDRRRRLLNRALLTTYNDCQLVGVGKAARMILEQAGY